ncbi:unnamed protein product [Ceratitis capitata]|uniref:(Mediterranean fruit fly) hypothetical protein n=1 Tax=Ceratitis capitata TaxID=7213 RepID=A0A811VF63_CERCA|nr:unnamed protein product [Ceratitis capitata]
MKNLCEYNNGKKKFPFNSFKFKLTSHRIKQSKEFCLGGVKVKSYWTNEKNNEMQSLKKSSIKDRLQCKSPEH